MTTTALASESPSRQTIRLAEQGPDISGRTRGEIVRDSIDSGVTEVVFDCSGVESMSPSFADEVFGKLAERPQRPRIEIINAKPEIVSLVRFAVQQRNGD
jgi:hypothetical protein